MKGDLSVMKKLTNGLLLPDIGMGTWKLNDNKILEEIIGRGYELGYRLIDTASSYSNEIAIGRSIKNLDIKRENLILQDKVWRTNYGFENTVNACTKSLHKLKMDYIDIYLVHWPASPIEYTDWEKINAETWRGMEWCYEKGFVHAIGVCNFKPYHFEALKKTANVFPMINQIEHHPGFHQKETLDYCKKEGMKIEAASPLGNGTLLQNDLIKRIAEKEKTNSSGLLLAYSLQQEITVLPRTSNADRLEENIGALDIKLEDETIKELDNLPFIGGLNLNSDEVIDFGKL